MAPPATHQSRLRAPLVSPTKDPMVERVARIWKPTSLSTCETSLEVTVVWRMKATSTMGTVMKTTR